MASLTPASVAALLKEVYPDGPIVEEIYKNAPLLGVLPKDTDAEGYGRQIHIPLIFADPQGRSADFTKGRTAATPTLSAAFDVTLANDYAFAFIDGETIDRMKSEKGSFIRALKPEIDRALRNLRNSLVHALYRNGGGAIGQISAASNPATPTITLANPSDIRYFAKGQILATSLTDGTSGVQKAGTVTVASVNRNTGTVTATGNWTAGIATALASDFVFVDGDFGAKVKGVEAWIPSTDPGATTFFGLDRSTDPMRLGGIRQDFSSLPIEEAVPRMLERMYREDASTDILTMHPLDWTNLQIALGSKVVYDTVEAYKTPTVGFQSIKVKGPMGDVDILADPNELPNVCHALQLDTWTLYSLGDIPKMLDNDGLAVLRNITSDGVEAQMLYRAQLACKAPGLNGRFAIGS